MTRRRAVSTGMLLALGLSGCAAANDQSTYASCMREPRSWMDGTTRDGYLFDRGNVHSDAVYEGKEGLFRTSITRAKCKDSLHLSGLGLDFHGGPWLPLWDEAFSANYRTNRAAFAYYAGEHRAYVWIDGTATGPYHDITVSPRFSASGEHVAYVIHESDGSFTLHTDTRKITNHPSVTSWPFFHVLDDGRVAAPSYRDDKKIQVVVGDYRSPPLDDLCDHRGFSVGAGSHWGFSGRLDGESFTVIDGVKVDVGGLPARCEILFGADGRSGYRSTAVAGEPASKQGVVLDSVYHPELELASDFAFQGSIPVATLDDRRPAEGATKVLLLMGLSTPAVPPTQDDLRSLPSNPAGIWYRVKIGDSLGPRLTKIEMASLSLEGGRVSYRGERGGVPVELEDNVILKRAAPSVAR